jgi:hypothetical protein
MDGGGGGGSSRGRQAPLRVTWFGFIWSISAEGGRVFRLIGQVGCEFWAGSTATRQCFVSYPAVWCTGRAYVMQLFGWRDRRVWVSNTQIVAKGVSFPSQGMSGPSRSLLSGLRDQLFQG